MWMSKQLVFEIFFNRARLALTRASVCSTLEAPFSIFKSDSNLPWKTSFKHCLHESKGFKMDFLQPLPPEGEGGGRELERERGRDMSIEY